MWIAAALAVPLTVAFTAVSTIDLTYLVRAGHIMLETGDVLRVNDFTFTARCEPWLNQQWGTEILVAGAFDGLGWLGLALLRAALAVGVAAFVFGACRAYGAERRAAAWLTVLASVLVLSSFQLRAQLLGLVLFAGLRWIVAGRTRHAGRLWWAVPLVLVWANVHGSFPLGIFLLVVAAVEDRVAGDRGRRSIVIIALASLATAVTPFGSRVWAYVIDLAADPLIRELSAEWSSPGLTTYTGVVFFASVGLAVLVFARNRRALSWPVLVELAVFLVLAQSSTRSVYWWGIVLATDLARLPWAHRGPAGDPRNRVNTVLAGVLVLVPLISVARWLPYASDEPPTGQLRYAPVALTEELRSMLRPGEPFGNPQPWGSWFELTLAGHPILVDSRFEIMPTETLLTSLRIAEASGAWEEDLEALPVRIFVVDRQHQHALVDALPSLEGWRQAYSDEDGLILVREDGIPAEPLSACDGG